MKTLVGWRRLVLWDQVPYHHHNVMLPSAAYLYLLKEQRNWGPWLGGMFYSLLPFICIYLWLRVNKFMFVSIYDCFILIDALFFWYPILSKSFLWRAVLLKFHFWVSGNIVLTDFDIMIYFQQVQKLEILFDYKYLPGYMWKFLKLYFLVLLFMMNIQHCKLTLFHWQMLPSSVNFWPDKGKEDISVLVCF